jgi:putative transposase
MRLHPQTYALTSSTYQGKRVFQRTEVADLMVATVLRYRDVNRFLVHGFAIMPDHIHILLTTGELIEAAAKLIKGGFSFAARNLYAGEIWNPGYHAHRVIDASDYRNQLAYIANNPLRKNYLDYRHVHTTDQWLLDPAPTIATTKTVPVG